MTVQPWHELAYDQALEDLEKGLIPIMVPMGLDDDGFPTLHYGAWQPSDADTLLLEDGDADPEEYAVHLTAGLRRRNNIPDNVVAY